MCQSPDATELCANLVMCQSRHMPISSCANLVMCQSRYVPEGHVIKPGMETGNEMKRNEMKGTRNVTKL